MTTEHEMTIDAASLRRLRGFVEAVHREDGRTVPFDRLVELASEVRLSGGVTIDFRATRDLGFPMVVVRVPQAREPAATFESLSPREREIVALVAEGLSNKQIAERLFISVATVKDHLHSVLEKTGFANRTALAVAYIATTPQV